MLKTTNIGSLSDDIMLEILVRVPAQDIYDSTRLVCRKWYKMIETRNFVHSHLQQSSTSGLLSVCKRTFMMMQNGRIEISKLSYGFEGKVLSSCNGLLLELRENLEKLYITNPVTKQHFALPPFPSGEVISNNRFAIAYAASSGAYKVVHVFDSNDGDLGCAIMTVGVDTDWRRRVSTQHLSNTAKMLLTRLPLTTQGFVHWARNGWALTSYYSDCVLTMNVESEIITQIPCPCLCLDGKMLWYCYLPMGSYLSLLIGEKSSWEVWKMKPETGEWTKMPSIDMELRKMFEHLSFRLDWSIFELLVKPVGWASSQDVLFFGVPNFAFPVFAAYNVRTQDIVLCELDSAQDLFVDHRSSLMQLD